MINVKATTLIQSFSTFQLCHSFTRSHTHSYTDGDRAGLAIGSNLGFMRLGGAGDPTSNPMINRQPVLSPQPQPPHLINLYPSHKMLHIISPPFCRSLYYCKGQFYPNFTHCSKETCSVDLPSNHNQHDVQS